MPNPKNVTTGPRRDPTTVPLLMRIRNEHVRSLELPPAAASTVDELSFVVDADELGRVRIYYRRYQYRHYRNRFWAWRLDRAEPVPDAQPAGPSAGDEPHSR